MDKKLIITPETKIGELLDNYPELEDVLIELTPTFKKLENPVLRKTIAKVTTIKQASLVGNIKLDVVINTLRKEIGQDNLTVGEDDVIMVDVPDWFSKAKIVNSLDAIPIVNGGGHPLDIVVKAVRQLEENQIYELITPFLPVPLIDKVNAMGFDSWTNQNNEDIFNTYFIKR